MVSIPVALGVGLILILLLIYCWSRNKKWVCGLSLAPSGDQLMLVWSWVICLVLLFLVYWTENDSDCDVFCGYVCFCVWISLVTLTDRGFIYEKSFLMCICFGQIWTILRWPLCGWQDIKILPWLFLSFVTVVSLQGGSWEAYKQCLWKILLWSLCHAEGPVWNLTLKVMFETAQL